MKKYFSIVLAFMLMMGSAVALNAQKASPASDFEYDLNEDDTGVIIKKYKGEAKDVVVPSVIEDFPVVELRNYAFGYTNIVSVVISNGVQTIGSDAFRGCTSLVSVTIGDGVQTIGSDAFSGCTSLTSINIPNSVKKISYGEFSGCTSLTSVTIGDGVQTIGGNAFRECTSLTSVTIGDGVKTIEGGAFRGCTSLVSITIGKGIKTIGGDAFRYCSSLTTFNIGVEEITYDHHDADGFKSDAFEGCSSLSLKDRIRIKKTGYTGSF